MGRTGGRDRPVEGAAPNTATGPLVCRRATPSDWAVMTGFTTAEPVAWVDAGRLRAEFATDNYRYAWTWLAERDGRALARALWWGRADAAAPSVLDCLLVSADVDDPAAVGAELLRTAVTASDAPSAPEYVVDVSPGWRADPRAAEAVAWRERAAHGAGLRHTTERISYAWTEESPPPAHPGRLRFRDGDDAEFRRIFGAVAEGSLDAHTVHMLAEHGPDALADDDLDFYLSLPGRREAWQVAEHADGPDGAPVGFIIPTRTAYDAAISYLGVLPEHRGNGHVHELLAEMVRAHRRDGADRIVGTTDADNTPMRAAFERAHFAVTRTRFVHES